MGTWLHLSKPPVGERSDNPFITYFRKEISIDIVPESFRIEISADSRYKLYVNGILAELGPAKGDRDIWFFDTVDIAEFLKTGVNTVAIEVLRYHDKPNCGNFGIIRTGIAGLWIGGDLSADGFKYILNDGIFMPLGTDDCTTLFNREIVHANPALSGWKLNGYNDSEWAEAVAYLPGEVSTVKSPGNLHPRRIPFMNKIHRKFIGTVDGNKEFDEMLRGNSCFIVKANSSCRVEINAGEEMTGLLRLAIKSGVGGHIRTTYAESYLHAPETGLPWKTDRTDNIHGHIAGPSDEYYIGGPDVYEQFFFKTFRFIAMEINAGAEDVVIESYDYKEVGYPLEVTAKIETADPVMNEIWDISIRTLRRCMHETYEDCPYYEQLQYSQDSRSQILFTYHVSGDDRLARNCMDDFRRSQHADGLLNSRYPDSEGQIIPSFSLYYIMMVYDHMMYFGDKELVRTHLPCIDRILSFFSNKKDKTGVVGKVGGSIGDRSWSFVDWTPEWESTGGSPLAGKYGPITIESMLFIIALEYAASLNEFVGRNDTANEYRTEAASVRSAVNAHCVDIEGVYTDGPIDYSEPTYSQHVQAFALLSDCCDKETGKQNLLKSLRNKANFAQCTVSSMFYLFRALEKAGIYEETYALWDLWRDMVKNKLTTCVENATNQRSDCHAWGALALYEIPAVILGARPLAPGFSEIGKPGNVMPPFCVKGTLPVKGEMIFREIIVGEGKSAPTYQNDK